MFFSCMRPTVNSALAAFCVLNRRLPFSSKRPQLHTISDVLSLSLSQSSNEPVGDRRQPPPSSSDKDWFSDGKEAARQLKLELRIVSKKDGDNPSTDSESKALEEGKLATRNAALESGRAAARELLKYMNTDHSENGGVGDLAKNDPEKKSEADKLQTKIETFNQQPSSDQSPDDYFNMKSRKEHTVTICLVPPPSATRAWEQLTAVRRECKDPGFYRWPPHVNILYPFLELSPKKNSKESYHVQLLGFRNEMAIHLAKAAQQCKPFYVTIDSFGTFGSKKRALLWAYPKSKYTQDCDEQGGEEPLINLHGFLEKQFPKCNEQRKGGAYQPHMTVSHYPNIDIASAAKEEVESKWKPITFHVAEIYLLERKGNGGQFKISATIPLGAGAKVELHSPPKAFPAMPEVEEEWVSARRKSVKKRRKRGFKKRKRRGGSQKKR